MLARAGSQKVWRQGEFVNIQVAPEPWSLQPQIWGGEAACFLASLEDVHA